LLVWDATHKAVVESRNSETGTARRWKIFRKSVFENSGGPRVFFCNLLRAVSHLASWDEAWKRYEAGAFPKCERRQKGCGVKV